jgi:GNAT superfamily N-acetyltransferase
MKREDNLKRMIQLAEEFFETKSDPAQISISRESMRKLRRIHPGTLKEKRDKSGPIAWVVVVPTTHQLMDRFLTKKITEQQLLDRTPPGQSYDALYLCSALVLPEHRGKGLAKLLISRAIKSIRKQHPIKHLFYWAFSAEGRGLAASVAKEFDLPLHARKQR